MTKGEAKARKKPTIVTIEESGRERKWGPLSRANAWRAGSFWEDMDREVKVFIVEEDKRKEVDVEKRLEGGREWFWFEEKVPQPPQEQGRDDNQIPEREEVAVMDEVDPEETQLEQMTSLAERIASLELENEEKERTIKNWMRRLPSLKEQLEKTPRSRLRSERHSPRLPSMSEGRQRSTRVQRNPLPAWRTK